MKDRLDSLDLREIIGYSIEAEKKSIKFYKKFVKFGKGKLVQERFESLMNDEEFHKDVLLNLHQKIYGNRDYSTPKYHDLPPHEDFDRLENVENLIDALEKAINNEYNAIRIYEYSAEKYEEHSSIFGYLAIMEHGHYKSLNKEKELYERKPDETDQKSPPEGIWKRLGLEGM